jgi:hypothetical protein
VGRGVCINTQILEIIKVLPQTHTNLKLHCLLNKNIETHRDLSNAGFLCSVEIRVVRLLHDTRVLHGHILSLLYIWANCGYIEA